MDLLDQQVTLPSLALRYLHAGPASGPPVVLLHGIGVTADIWRPNIPALAAAGFAVYAPDAPGFGDSDKPPGVYSLDFFFRILHEFVEWIDSGPVVLVGNSMGGAIALTYALRRAENVRMLILADPFGAGVWIPVTIGHFTQLLFPALITTLFGRVDWAFRRIIGFNFYNPACIPEELIGIARSRDWRRNTPGRFGAVLGLARDLGLPHQRRRFLQKLRSLAQTPTLIVWGENDQLLPVSHAQELQRALPNARLYIFPRCGHVPPVEEAKAFNQMVVAFLKGRDGEQRISRKKGV